MVRKCPSCGRLFQAKEIKRETLGAYEFREPGNRGGYIQGHAENFRVTFKCQSCCHEWTEVSEKTLHDHFKLPRL
jgi:hypothetical protein